MDLLKLDSLAVAGHAIPCTQFSKLQFVLQPFLRHCMEKKGKIFHRVAPSFQARMIANWTTHGYYCTHSRSHEELVAAGEELARKY